jgi:hypothetical protein
MADLDPITEDDSNDSALPDPPKPRPNLVRLDNLPIQPGKRVVPYVHPSMADKVTGFIDELRRNRVPVMLREVFRTTAMQASPAIQGSRYGAAAPGRSLHEAGYAIDINFDEFTSADQARAKEIAKKYGLRWGGDFKHNSDAPHFYLEPFGGDLEKRAAAVEAAQQEFREKVR